MSEVVKKNLIEYRNQLITRKMALQVELHAIDELLNSVRKELKKLYDVTI